MTRVNLTAVLVCTVVLVTFVVLAVTTLAAAADDGRAWT